MIDILSYRQWAISQHFANTMGLLSLRLLSEGKSIDHLIKRHTPEDLHARYSSMASADGLVVSTEWDRESQLEVATTRTGQNVAIIPVLGALTKRGDLCSYGMRDYISMIDRANKSQKIAGILLDIESPGGTVDGTNEFGIAVKQSKKPVVAFGDGMVASAAYWVASQAREIIANKNNATEFGSIGVLYIHENYQAYIQREIGSVEIIRAPQSEDKARINVIEPITDEQRSEIRMELKELAKEFFSIVKAGRGSRLNTAEENIFTGKMYPAGMAKKMGMIDSLGTIQDAIDRVGRLANSNSTSASKGAQVNTSMKFSKLSALFSGEAWGKALSAFAEDQAPLESAEQKVVEMEAASVRMKAENDQLKADASAKDQKITALEATVSEQKTQITSLTNDKTKLEGEKNELNEKLEKKPTGAVTTIIPGNGEEAVNADGQKSATEKKRYLTSVDQQAEQIREQQKKSTKQ